MNILWIGVGGCTLFNGLYGSVWTFDGSVWMGVHFLMVNMGWCESFMGRCGWVCTFNGWCGSVWTFYGSVCCELFMGGCRLVWVGVGRWNTLKRLINKLKQRRIFDKKGDVYTRMVMGRRVQKQSNKVRNQRAIKKFLKTVYFIMKKILGSTRNL